MKPHPHLCVFCDKHLAYKIYLTVALCCIQWRQTMETVKRFWLLIFELLRINDRAVAFGRITKTTFVQVCFRPRRNSTMHLNLCHPHWQVRTMVSSSSAHSRTLDQIRNEMLSSKRTQMDSLVQPLVAQYLAMGYQSKENSQHGNIGSNGKEKEHP